MKESESPATQELRPFVQAIADTANSPLPVSLPQAVEQAQSAYRGGDWSDAERWCKLILYVQADCFEALTLLGIIAARTQRLEEAAAAFGRCVALQPQNAGVLNNYANVLKDLKRFDEALASYQRVLEIMPNFAEAYNNYGNALKAVERFAEALASYERALTLNPNLAQAHQNRGFTLQELGRFHEALDSYARALEIRPDHPESHYCRGVILQKLQRFEEALRSYERALEIKPDHAEAHYGSGAILQKLGRIEQALPSYERALRIRPDLADGWCNRGNILQKLERIEEALESYGRALEIVPDHADACCNRGVGLYALERFEEALASYERTLEIAPDHAEGHNNRGNALQALKRYDEALASFGRALEIRPDYAEAHNNRGITLQKLQRYDEALASFERALEIRPDYAEAHNNRGNTLQELVRFHDALDSYGRALSIKPDSAESYNNRGNTLLKLERFDDALDSYQRALKIAPDFAEAHNNRGALFQKLKRFEESLDSYGRALAIDPEFPWLYGNWLHACTQLCDWRDWDAHVGELLAKVQRGERAALPFSVLALTDSLPLQREAAQLWAQESYPVSHALPPIGKRGRHEKIRISYFSGDFRNHPVSVLLASMLEGHDRSRFEVTGFSFGPDTRDEMRKRVESACDRFIEVRGRSDPDIVRLARSLEVDIAVDLGGFTAGGRPNVFAMRAAPLQVSYLGFLGTMGAEYIDYLIADATIIPAEHREHYAEKIVYLPSYQANDSKRVVSDKLFSREELGLPASGFVFCCMNASYKIVPAVFDGWMRILSQVEGSVLFLFADAESIERNLRREAQRRGVDPGRLVFARRLPFADYLARYRAADLFLDTLPYNAGTTASDALWAGLPVLTCIGEAFAARVAASLLNAVGLPELIAATPQHYEALAVELATRPERLQQIRRKLAANRLTTPLFDTETLTRNIEKAYTLMYQRHHNDSSPDHIHVAT